MVDNFEEKWQVVANEVDRRGGDGKAVVDAFLEHYKNYTFDACRWLARLFDEDTGGFYYSNSARDNEQFLPDMESTNQATNYLLSSGVIKSCDELPEKMKESLIAFCKSLQSPEDGYIYHPQWGKNITDHRRGRDLMWAESMARKFHFKYPYPTALERLKAWQDSPVENKDSVEALPAHLKSREAFLEYLEGYDWKGDAYYSGNNLVAQVLQVSAAGLTDTAIEFLNSIQNPETGLWGERGGYPAINALLKIGYFYTKVGVLMPNSDKAAMAVMDIMVSDTECQSVCWQYNCWFSLTNIITGLRSLLGEEGNRKADEISALLLVRAPEAIRATARKVATFKKADGSFSYKPHRTSPTAQGAPVALENTNEGDVNATNICTGGITEHIWRALELSKFEVSIFGEKNYKDFLSALPLKNI